MGAITDALAQPNGPLNKAEVITVLFKLHDGAGAEDFARVWREDLTRLYRDQPGLLDVVATHDPERGVIVLQFWWESAAARLHFKQNHTHAPGTTHGILDEWGAETTLSNGPLLDFVGLDQ